MVKDRNLFIDVLKGIAIVAVVLYHWGISKYGYLGVDVFFVISGYLVAKGLVKNFGDSAFSYWKYLNKRISRLWPGLILISIIALGLGYIWMLPLHFKLDCESVIGTCLFGNNFIQYITSGNYWMADNEYKPLMHTWYIGILMQFYLIIPLVFIVAKRFAKQWLRVSFNTIGILCLLSMALYLSPLMTEAQNFYMLPGRFFELGLGAMSALYSRGSTFDLNYKFLSFCFILALVIYLIFGFEVDANKLRLIVVAILSLGLVWRSNLIQVSPRIKRVLLPLSFMGVASYSLYLSHQVFFAFYRYAFDNEFTIIEHIIILVITVVLGVLLYFFFEKQLSGYITKHKNNMYHVNSLCLMAVVLLVGIAGYFYKQNGLVRDIPELDLYLDAQNETPEDYNSRIFEFDKEFESNGRRNILVIGDSFSRDWINVLLESGVDSVMNISYHTDPDDIVLSRIKQADYVFIANNASLFEKYSKILPLLTYKKFYRVGIKGFGSWAGLVYNNNRNGSDYYTQVVKIPDTVAKINNEEKSLFAEKYIDMMQPVTVSESQIIMFTDDYKLISQDCLHLTKAGAKMYAKKIDVWQYLK